MADTNDNIFFKNIPAKFQLTVDEQNVKRFGKKEWTQVAVLAGTTVSKNISRKDMINAIRKHCVKEDVKLTYDELRTRMINYNDEFKEQREKDESDLQGINTDNDGKQSAPVFPPNLQTQTQTQTHITIDDNGNIISDDNNDNNGNDIIHNGEEIEKMMNLNRNLGTTPVQVKSLKNTRRTVLNRDNINFVHGQLNNLQTDMKDNLDNLHDDMKGKLDAIQHDMTGINTKTKDQLEFMNGINANINGRLNNIENVMKNISKNFDLELKNKNNLIIQKDLVIKDSHITNKNLQNEIDLLTIQMNTLKKQQENMNDPLDESPKTDNIQIINNDNNAQKDNTKLETDGLDDLNDNDFKIDDLVNEIKGKQQEVVKKGIVYDKPSDYNVQEEKYNDKVFKVSFPGGTKMSKRELSVKILELFRKTEIDLNMIEKGNDDKYKIFRLRYGAGGGVLSQIYFKNKDDATAFFKKCKINNGKQHFVYYWRNTSSKGSIINDNYRERPYVNQRRTLNNNNNNQWNDSWNNNHNGGWNNMNNNFGGWNNSNNNMNQATLIAQALSNAINNNNNNGNQRGRNNRNDNRR